MKTRRETPVPKGKLKTVENLKDLIKNKKTILIASIKNLPGRQFQEIVKKLRGKAVIKVLKKNLIFRALDESGDETAKELKEQINDSVVVLFSDLDSFELAAELLKNKTPAKAKAGQEAPEDIVVQEGPTELIPGPAISELGALGIQIQIEKGKINIKTSKVIVKKGEKISSQAADVMAKLDIRPFSIGFTPLCAFDNKEGKLYLDIKIDREGTLEELKRAYSRAIPFAVEIGYACKESISFLIRKAGVYGKAVKRLLNTQSENSGREEK